MNKVPTILDEQTGTIVLYRDDADKVRVSALLKNETLWMTQAQIAALFDVNTQAITKHIKNIYEDGELVEAATCSKMEQVHLHFHKIDFAGTRLFQRHIISSAVTLARILLPHRQRIYLYPRLPNSMCTLRPHLRQWQSSAAPNSVSPSGRQKKSYSAFSFKPMHSLHGYIRLVKKFLPTAINTCFHFAFDSTLQQPVSKKILFSYMRRNIYI